jgi:hypothetical protein
MGNCTSEATFQVRNGKCKQFVMYHISTLVLYGCETWALILKETHTLSTFGNRVLRRIFGCKAEKVAGGWRQQHDEECKNLYTVSNIIK